MIFCVKYNIINNASHTFWVRVILINEETNNTMRWRTAIEIRFLFYFLFFCIIFCETLTFNDIAHEIMSGNLSFTLDPQIKERRTTAPRVVLIFNSSWLGRLVADWSFGNMIQNLTWTLTGLRYRLVYRQKIILRTEQDPTNIYFL